MYCPECLNDSLFFNEKGVLEVTINGKRMNTSKMFFNLVEKTKSEFLEDLKLKLTEYIEWYSKFENRKDIKEVIISSSDIKCDLGCKIPMVKKVSAVPELLSNQELEEILQTLCSEFSLNLALS